MNREQRALLSEKVFDAANVAAGAMLFGQFVGAGGFSIRIALLGLIVWLGFVGWALRLQRGERQ